MTEKTQNNASAPVGLTVHVSERALAAMATAGIVLDLRHEDEMSPERHQPITVQQGQPMETPQAWITEGTITTDLQGSMIYQGKEAVDKLRTGPEVCNPDHLNTVLIAEIEVAEYLDSAISTFAFLPGSTEGEMQEFRSAIAQAMALMKIRHDRWKRQQREKLNQTPNL